MSTRTRAHTHTHARTHTHTHTWIFPSTYRIVALDRHLERLVVKAAKVPANSAVARGRVADELRRGQGKANARRVCEGERQKGQDEGRRKRVWVWEVVGRGSHRNETGEGVSNIYVCMCVCVCVCV